MKKNLILEQWSSKEAGDFSVSAIKDETTRESMAQLMENIATRDLSGRAGVLTEAWDSGISNFGSAPGANTGTNNMAYPNSENIYANDPANVFRPVALALMRRSFPDLFAHKCVAVQPMQQPYGVAFAMRMVYAGTDIEAGWDNVPQFQHQSGTVKVIYAYDNAGTIGAGEFNGINATTGRKIDIYTAQGKVDETKLKAAIVAANAAVGVVGNITALTVSSQGAPLKHTEGLVMKDNRFGAGTIPGSATGNMTELEFKLAQRAIRAMGRKMGASYSLESAQDIQSMHSGLNIEKEMLGSLNYEMNAQLDREIVDVIKYVSEDMSPNMGGAQLADIDLDPAVAGNAIGRWNGEIFMTVIATIMAQANVLALTTGRGAGNFVVVSQDIATALQAAGHQFVQYKGGVNPTQSVAYIGKLNGTIDCYRDRYATESFALVGYKGAGLSEAGVIYSPFITALTNRAINPADFSPRIGVMSRYSITHNLLGAGRYYRMLRFNGVNKIIPGAVSNVLPGTGTSYGI